MDDTLPFSVSQSVCLSVSQFACQTVSLYMKGWAVENQNIHINIVNVFSKRNCSATSQSRTTLFI